MRPMAQIRGPMWSTPGWRASKLLLLVALLLPVLVSGQAPNLTSTVTGNLTATSTPFPMVETSAETMMSSSSEYVLPEETPSPALLDPANVSAVVSGAVQALVNDTIAAVSAAASEVTSAVARSLQTANATASDLLQAQKPPADTTYYSLIRLNVDGKAPEGVSLQDYLKQQVQLFVATYGAQRPVREPPQADDDDRQQHGGGPEHDRGDRGAAVADVDADAGGDGGGERAEPGGQHQREDHPSGPGGRLDRFLCAARAGRGAELLEEGLSELDGAERAAIQLQLAALVRKSGPIPGARDLLLALRHQDQRTSTTPAYNRRRRCAACGT
eukprot:461710-Hanusia_phi.AAC.5